MLFVVEVVDAGRKAVSWLSHRLFQLRRILDEMRVFEGYQYV